MLSLIADDVVFLLPGRPEMRKGGFRGRGRALSQHRAAPQIEASSDIQEIEVLGEWAFMWTRLTVVVTPRRRRSITSAAGHTLTILRKQAGKWRLARDANLLA